MRKTWLIFTQSVTVCLGLLFVLRSFYPQLLEPETKLATAPAPVVVQQVNPSTAPTSHHTTFSHAAVKAMPAVVNIFTSSQRPAKDIHERFRSDPFFKRFFGEESNNYNRQPDNSLGSGVIVSPKGLILTNNHVVSTADAIEVALADGRKLPATIVGADPETDLAVLKIEDAQLPAITFADPKQLKVGDIALAIGNPFGVGQTVTQGIISALGRSHLGINTYENFIQTDASINPGNSGGALIDVDGNLIGINSAIYSRNGGSMGIGFAIPVSIAKQVMDQITTTGSVTRGWIGIEAQDMSAELADSFGLDNANGSLIAGVLRDSPADIGGLKAGDVLVSIDKQLITDSKSMLNLIAALKPNEKSVLGIMRQGELIDAEIIVGKRPIPTSVKR